MLKLLITLLILSSALFSQVSAKNLDPEQHGFDQNLPTAEFAAMLPDTEEARQLLHDTLAAERPISEQRPNVTRIEDPRVTRRAKRYV